MAIELDRLIKKASHLDITFLAGKKGIHNLVSWVHMVETSEASDFLYGGEIAFITGLGLNSNTTMLRLAENIYKKNAAGIIVNTGPFLEKVPDDVIQFCEAHNFPLFVVPWKIHLAEIMRIFCFAITKDEQKNIETAAAFKNAIFFPGQEELYLVPLSQHGFRVNWKYSACTIKLKTNTANLPQRLEKLAYTLENYANHHYKNFAEFISNDDIILVIANYSETDLRKFVKDMKEQTMNFLQKSESIAMGCGKLTKSIRCLYKSYNQANSIVKLQELNKISSSFVFYSDMGIYKLLMGIDDKEIMRDYCEGSIQPLIEYDNKNATDLADVLRCYLKHNGSVKDASEELFVHRNTINYKLGKIQEFLGLDLSLLDTRLQLSLAFMLLDLL